MAFLSVSFSVSFVYGLHISQTYDLPDVVKSARTMVRFVAGDGVFPRKKRGEEEDEEDDR